MGFKKLSKEELMYAMYDNIIGIPVIDKGKGSVGQGLDSGLKKNKDSSKSLEKSKDGGTSADRGKKISILKENQFTIEMDSGFHVISDESEEKITIRNPASVDRIWNIQTIIGGRRLLIPEILASEEWIDISEKNREVPNRVS